MYKVVFLLFLFAVSCSAKGQKKYTMSSSQNSYTTHAKEEANHYEVNHYEYEHKPYPYRFGYDVKDEKGNIQFHKEEGDEYNVKKGSYGYTDAYGIYRHVDYIADHLGFRAKIRTNEPGTANYHPAHVTIYSEAPPSHVYSAYDKSAHSAYGQSGHGAYDNEAHGEYEKTAQPDYDKQDQIAYVKADHDGQGHIQQNGHEGGYPKLDEKYTYVPVYVSNDVEYKN